MSNEKTVSQSDIKKTKKASWDDTKDGFLVTQLVKMQRQGKRADNGFKRNNWEDIARRLNAHFQVAYTHTQLKSRLILVSRRML